MEMVHRKIEVENVANVEMLPMSIASSNDGGGKLDIGSARGLSAQIWIGLFEY